MGLAPLPEEGEDIFSQVPTLCETCGAEHTLRFVLKRSPGNVKVRVVADPNAVQAARALAGGTGPPEAGKVVAGRYVSPFP